MKKYEGFDRFPSGRFARISNPLDDILRKNLELRPL